MPGLDLAAALRTARGADPGSIPNVLSVAARGLEATDVVLYLVDFAQTVLEPVADHLPHLELSHSEDVRASVAGRVFVEQRPRAVERPEGVRVWVPVVEGSDRTGVLALTVPEADESTLGACEDLGLLAGYLIATQARVTDVYNLSRRRRALSLAASMQWDILPPLVLKAGAVAVAGLLEPAYDVGGDSFDYSLNGPQFDMAIIDAMGHGVGAALMSALAIGSYRHDRREGRALPNIHATIDEAVKGHYRGNAFITGQLARLQLDTGRLSWTNAGHPLPLLIRQGRVVGEIRCRPTPPWGFCIAPAEVAEESLEPGDSVLFYTDGVVEARTPEGERFGVERLIDLAGQNASDEFEPEEIVRRLVQSVLEHQQNELPDDATMILVHWRGRSTDGDG